MGNEAYREETPPLADQAKQRARSRTALPQTRDGPIGLVGTGEPDTMKAAGVDQRDIAREGTTRIGDKAESERKGRPESRTEEPRDTAPTFILWTPQTQNFG